MDLSSLIKPLITITAPLIKKAKGAAELYNALRGKRQNERRLIDENFDKAYSALLHYVEGGKRSVFHVAFQELVSINEIKDSNIQIWLNDTEVKNAFYSIAKLHILQGNPDKQKFDPFYKYLLKTYPLQQEDSKHKYIIKNISSALVNYCLAGLDAGQRVALAVNQDINKKIENISSAGSQAIIRENDANIKRRLEIIIERRGIPGYNFIEEIEKLLDDVSSSNNSQSVYLEVLYWGVRLLSGSKDKLDHAKKILSDIKKTSLDYNIRTLEAFILKADDELPKAIDVLNSINTQDSRSILCTWLNHENRIEWYKGLEDKCDDFLNGRAWISIIDSHLKKGYADEVFDLISQIPENTFKNFPYLHYFCGMVLITLILPENARKGILEEGVIAPAIPISVGEKEGIIYEKAIAHLKTAMTYLDAIEAFKGVNHAEIWLAWMYLQKKENLAKGKSLVDQGILNAQKLNAYVFMCTRLNVDFDLDLAKKTLNSKKILGVHSPEDMFTHALILKEEGDFPSLIKHLDEAKEELISYGMEEELWIFYKLDAFLQIEDFQAAENLLFDNEDKFDQDELDRYKNKILHDKGEPISDNLIQMYEKTKDLIDLQNLCNSLERAEDFTLLEKYSLILFKQHKTLENGLKLLQAAHKNESFLNVIEMYELNIDIFSKSDVSMSVYGWSLYELGRFKELSHFLHTELANNFSLDVSALRINSILYGGEWTDFSSLINKEKSLIDERTPEYLIQFASIISLEHKKDAVEFIVHAVNKASEDPSILLNAHHLAVSIGEESIASDWLQAMLSIEDNKLVKQVPLAADFMAQQDLGKMSKFIQDLYEKHPHTYSEVISKVKLHVISWTELALKIETILSSLDQNHPGDQTLYRLLFGLRGHIHDHKYTGISKDA